MQPINKRPYHAFLSHAHADKTLVDRLYTWLSSVAQIPIWYDGANLPASAKIATYLPKAIVDCRAMILVLSKASLKSGWVEEEYSAAIEQRTRFSNYKLIPVRIDDCDPSGFLGQTKWIDIANNEITLENYRELLAAFYYDDFFVNIDQHKSRDVYVSRTWRDKEAPLADKVCFSAMDAGFRLLGDSEDQMGFEQGKRVESIIKSCGALLAILPDRGNGVTSPYMLTEIELAQKHNIPFQVIAESTVKVPDTFLPCTTFIAKEDASDGSDVDKIANSIEILRDEWRTPPHPHYIFFATSFDDKVRNQIIKNIIQLITGMPCYMGDEIREQSIQEVIVNRIEQAFLMVADISNDNVNVCIEAGIARGARTKMYLVAAAPRRSPPFMFRDQEVWHYTDNIELIGIIHRLIHPYRCRILNYEVNIKARS